MMMRSLVKLSQAKRLARETKYFKWELVTFNFYYLEYQSFHFYKRIHQRITGNLQYQMI